ncbi:MAG: hypothetical protein AB7U52_01875 [Candidatus Izemoplasmatales bacterium]
MEKILKKIKEEFKAFVKEDKAKIKFSKFHNLQSLSLLPATNIRKKMVKIEFIYFVKESGLDVKITYIKRNDEQKEIEKAFTFSQVTKDLSLPMIDNDIIDDIANSFKYEIFDGKLKSTISPENQATTFVRIIKNDWNSIINYLDIV